MNLSETDTLLNIKQAAKFLNVSEISLRRWSDSGKLPCLRVGLRRERRFVQADLFSYLNQDSPTEHAKVGDGKCRVAHIELEGIAIEYGSHLCSFYETDPGRLKLALPFLLGGLEKGDRCFVVATAEVQTIFLQELCEVKSTINQAIDNGQLVMMDGLSSGAEMLDFFECAFIQANKQNIQGLRVLGDMAWALKKISIEALTEFEARYNQGLGHRFPVVSLCQYDARLFSGTAILGALKCHGDTFRYPLTHFVGT